MGKIQNIFSYMLQYYCLYRIFGVLFQAVFMTAKVNVGLCAVAL